MQILHRYPTDAHTDTRRYTYIYPADTPHILHIYPTDTRRYPADTPTATRRYPIDKPTDTPQIHLHCRLQIPTDTPQIHSRYPADTHKDKHCRYSSDTLQSSYNIFWVYTADTLQIPHIYHLLTSPTDTLQILCKYTADTPTDTPTKSPQILFRYPAQQLLQHEQLLGVSADSL